MQEPSKIPTLAFTSTVISPTITITVTAPTTGSNHTPYWLDTISKAETQWLSSKINSYEVVGRASWAWHEHSFQVNVVDGKIISSKCEVAYDNLPNNQWCETQFNASDHIIPALFKRARELVKFGDETGSPQDDCFYALFNLDTGAPEKMSLDCPNANDEEEDWLIIFFQNVH